MPTVHFLRSVWMQKRSWLYSIPGFHEDRSLDSSSLFTLPSPCLPWPPASVQLVQYCNLLLITEKNVQEEKSEARSWSK